ncbi:MAG: lipocalin family protein [Bacteroidota bacterium]
MKKSINILLLFIVVNLSFNLAFGQDRQGETLEKTGFTFSPGEEDRLHGTGIEWWYYFGYLRSKGTAEDEYIFVSSFFRNKVGRYMFYTLTDLKKDTVYFYALLDKSTKFNSPFLPKGHKYISKPYKHCEPPRSPLWLCYGNNKLQKEDSLYHLFFTNKEFTLTIDLKKEGHPMLVMGSGIIGLKRPEDMHYYSYPHMSAKALLKLNDQELELVGDAWYDHQWGKMVIKSFKWGWWGINLDNDQAINVYFIKNAVTNRILQIGLTLLHPDGRTEVFTDLKFTAKRYWKSPDTGRKYPVDWEIEVPGNGLKLNIKAITDNNEFPVLVFKRIWEGPCKVLAVYENGETVQGKGFQELLGKVKKGNK